MRVRFVQIYGEKTQRQTAAKAKMIPLFIGI